MKSLNITNKKGEAKLNRLVFKTKTNEKVCKKQSGMMYIYAVR